MGPWKALTTSPFPARMWRTSLVATKALAATTIVRAAEGPHFLVSWDLQ